VEARIAQQASKIPLAGRAAIALSLSAAPWFIRGTVLNYAEHPRSAQVANVRLS
jgi:hypothetical protein